MYWLNKIVWLLLNPMSLTLVGMAVGVVLAAWFRGRWRRAGFVAFAAAFVLLWFFSTPACVCLLGCPLERPYRATQTVASLPMADAIVVLGGGVGKTDNLAYPDLFDAADRVWHAARLYRAGKAPRVVVSGCNDLAATVPLLLDLGVPRAAVVVDNESRNTYENSRFTERLLAGGGAAKVLLVTSAWHMTRACGNFSKTSLEVVPAACDFKASFVAEGVRRWWDALMPSAESLGTSCCLAKEWLGRLARK